MLLVAYNLVAYTVTVNVGTVLKMKSNIMGNATHYKRLIVQILSI